MSKIQIKIKDTLVGIIEGCNQIIDEIRFMRLDDLMENNWLNQKKFSILYNILTDIVELKSYINTDTMTLKPQTFREIAYIQRQYQCIQNSIIPYENDKKFIKRVDKYKEFLISSFKTIQAFYSANALCTIEV